MTQFECPFCGESGRPTKEHVWAQWLHKTEAARALLAGTHGERVPQPGAIVTKGEDGRHVTVKHELGAYAKWLPHVTVRVCKACNNGWMKRLEDDAKELLAPFLFDRVILRLEPEDLSTISTWATKSWMAYALTRPSQSNPFSEAEYQAMAESPHPLERSRIWLARAEDPRAQVSMGIESMLLSRGEQPPDLSVAHDNTAYALTAISSVVLIMLMIPPDAPEELFDVLNLPLLSSPGARRIWPSPRRQFFPLDEAGVRYREFIDLAPKAFRDLGLPVDGLTDEDTATVMEQFRDGADLSQLRQQWSSNPSTTGSRTSPPAR